MGILDALVREGQRISGVEIFAPDGYSTRASLSGRRGLPTPMLVVPRMRLDDVIRRRAVQSGARFESGVLVTDIARSPQGVVIEGTRMGRSLSLSARIAIVATGASTGLLRKLGLLPETPQTFVLGSTS